VFAVMPVLDFLIGRDLRNPSPAEERTRLGNAVYDIALYSTVPAQLALLVWAVDVVASEPLAWFELIGFTLSVGIATGTVGINVGHELVHREAWLSRACGTILLLSTTYAHFRIEHVYGHHRWVGTPRDPATAREGESVYAFYARTLPGQLASAWAIEHERLDRAGHGVWSPRNRMLQYLGIYAVIYAACAVWGGWLAAAFFLGQSLVAGVLMLETVNYIEHYGLLRRERAPGRYEPVTPRHSWDSYHRLNNLFLFNLGRHSDHHAHASRHYPVLRTHEAAPRMPAGYAAMMLLAWLPPLWFRVMDPKVEAWKAAGEAAPAE
jgi:alkane 1-monooxygenase